MAKKVRRRKRLLLLFKTAQNSKNIRLNGHTSFEFQTRNYVTCIGHICNHPHGQENHTQNVDIIGYLVYGAKDGSLKVTSGEKLKHGKSI